MEILIWMVLALLAAGVAFIAFRLIKPPSVTTDPQLSATLMSLNQAQSELAGRLAQITDTSTVAQASLAKALNERLDALGSTLLESQNTAQATLATSLNERLDAMGKRVGDSLIESTEKTTLTMTDLQKRLAVIDEAQRNLTDLSTQVVSLQDILSNKQARGAFGEIQLGDMVRDMLPVSAYELQAQLGNGKRADCLIRLPNPHGAIAIDSKFPLEGYRAIRDARDEASRIAAERMFAANVRKHLDDIAERYIVPGETAESAIMFLPSDAVYLELNTNFISIVEYGHRVRVYIVSPSTMWATLNTIRALLKDVRMREQAGVIQQEVLKLLKDVERLQKRTENLRTHFASAEKDIREIEISTDKIVSRAEKIEQVQLTGDGTTMDELPIGSTTAKILLPN